ncbi:MAG: PstS family phosphate ABC transporter substrate-binding protein [Armatimonadetes bacterium]|nr:PstS family phosphate ABC transporter substrate-binding protein [Armatimonadota bacterium]
MKRKIAVVAAIVVTAALLAGLAVSQVEVAYAAQNTIRQIGSTTLLPMAEKWQAAFNKKHPNVDIAVSGGGSGTGIKALIAGTAEIADASRPIKDSEVKQAKEGGINPVEHVVAYDGIAVIVHPSNPVKELSLQQISDIYVGKIRNWSEVGVRGMGEIQVVNRDSSSGTYEVFKEIVVQLHTSDTSRDFTPRALNQSSNQAVHALVARTKGAVGYVGLGYLDKQVKAVGVSDGGKATAPSIATVRDGSYPISRKLFCYTNGQPSGTLKTYIDWIKGAEGQAIAKEVGFVPVSE